MVVVQPMIITTHCDDCARPLPLPLPLAASGGQSICRNVHNTQPITRVRFNIYENTTQTTEQQTVTLKEFLNDPTKPIETRGKQEKDTTTMTDTQQCGTETQNHKRDDCNCELI
jgi:hypothetical protein